MAKVGRKTGVKNSNQADKEDTLTSCSSVCRYLAAKGHDISEPTISRHVREGKLKKNGLQFDPVAVDAYIATHLAAEEGNGDKTGLQNRKLAAETQRIELDAEMRILRLQEARGELIPKSEVEVAFAERANGLANYLFNIAKTAAPRIVKECDGKSAKAGHLSEWLMEMFKKALDGYARPLDFASEGE